ncbi:AAA family ATPase, partial [Paenibacillus tyrfis]|uniref:AAA family ATPase n=1 Tax=Paenibacillus tyrfis TaxID=1501230 RepID=UPI00209CCDFB
MRIERLDVRRYGVLNDVELLADSPITLFCGPNEAGKSTVLGFIRDVLFGFPRGGSAERLTVPGEGGHGGAITLVDEQGRRYRVERWERPSGGRGRGPAAGSVRVTFPDGTSGGERELAALLGGITPELFRSLFAFGLTELQELGTLQSGEVGSFLYSAGLGASGSVIRGADKKLAQELEQLYRPRGRTPLMNRALQELAAAEAELAQSRGRAERYNALEAEANRLAVEQETLEGELDKLQREADWLARCVRAQPHWLRREELRRELAELPEMLDAFPADALPRMEAVLAERERLTVELDRVALALSDLKEGLRTVEAEAEAEGAVLERRAALEALLDRLPAYEEAKRTLTEAEAEEEQLGLELERMLRRIHPAWTPEHLDRLPSTVMLREEASAFREEWRVWRQNESLLEAEAERLRSESAAEELGPADGRSGAEVWDGEGDRDDSVLEEGLNRSRSIDGARAEERFALEEDRTSVEEGLERIRTARRLFHEWKEALREVRFEAEREQDREKLSRLEAQAGPETVRSGSSGVSLYVLYGATLLLPAALAALQQTAAAGAALAVLLAASAAWTLARRRAAQSRSGRGRRPYAGGAAPAAAGPAPALAALREQAAAREAALAAELRRLARYAA